MKNLKKVLALGLALVMLLGMFTIASAAETKKVASDFTDWDKVEHKDAVALCVDLGIIEGKPDGSYAPEETIDRASWAKLVYFTATGDDNADAYLGTASGLKDVTGNWAESYINYLVANKYVSGDNNGNYLPSSTITVAAAAKTMLTVLGYDSVDRGYENNAAWAGNIMTDAKTNGLMSDVDRAQTAMVNLTRDNAAQLVYNALQAQTVEATFGRDQGEKYVTTYNKGTILARSVFNVVPVDATVDSINTDGEAIFKDVTCDYSSYINVGNLKGIKASSTVVGERVTVFVEVKNNGGFVKVVSSSVAKKADTAAATYTNGVTISDITTSGKDDYVGKPASVVSYYVDGKSVAALAADYKAGNVVEVYTNDEGAVSMIKVTTYSVGKVTDAVETRTSDGELYVKVPGIISTWTLASKVVGYQGLEKDDIVVYNLSNDGNKNYTLTKAEKVTGSVTNKSGSKLTINGTQYEQSGITNNIETKAAFKDWKVADNKDNEYDFYLDLNGTICHYVLVEGEESNDIAYVLETAWVAGSGINASKYLEANLLFSDGTTEVVRVAKVKDNDDASMEKAEESDATKLASKLLAYSVNKDGNYEVTLKSTKNGTAGDIAQKPVFSTGLTANNNTVFLVKKQASADDDATYYSYTGYKNVPKMNATTVKYIANDKNVVTYAFLDTTKFEGDGADGLVYVTSESYDEGTESGVYVYTVVDAEGSEVSLAVDANNLEIGFYIVDSINEDEVATLKAASTDTSIKTGDKITCGDGVVTVGNESGIEYDESTVAVVVDMNEKGEYDSAGTFSFESFSMDEANYKYDVKMIVDDGVAAYVYVVRTLKPVVAG